MTSSPTANLLSLTHKYRSQTVALIARQEALLSEQKAIFELERQLWATEREMWEEERSLLLRNKSDSEREQVPITKPAKMNGQSKNRQSSGGGGIGWFLKQGSRQPTQSFVDSNVSPRNSHITEQEDNVENNYKSKDARRESVLSKDELKEEDEDEIDLDDDFSTIPSSLLAEASRLIYGDRAHNTQATLIPLPPPPPPRARQLSSSLPGASRLTPKLVHTSSRTISPVTSSSAASFASERSKSVSSGTAPSTNGNTTKPQRTKRGSHYLASFSENSSEDEGNATAEIHTAEEVIMPRTPMNTTFTIPPRHKENKPIAKKPLPIDNDDDERDSDSPPPPLVLRSSANFGTAFGSLKTLPDKKPRPTRTSSSFSRNSTNFTMNDNNNNNRNSTTNATNISFYHPETPVENIVSFGTKGWKTLEASGALKASHDNLHSAYNNDQPTNVIKSTELTLPSTWKGQNTPISPGQPSPSVFPYPPEPLRPNIQQPTVSSLLRRRSGDVKTEGSGSNPNHSDGGHNSGSSNDGRRSERNNGSNKSTSPTLNLAPPLGNPIFMTAATPGLENTAIDTNSNNDINHNTKPPTSTPTLLPTPSSSHSSNNPRISAVNPTSGTYPGMGLGLNLGPGTGLNSPRERDRRWGGEIREIGGMI